MPDTRYDHDHGLRDAAVALLDEYGYELDSFALADKHRPGDTGRSLTIKASRSLDVAQQRLGLE